MLTLFHAPRSRSGRIVWLLEELGADYDLRYVTIRHGDGSGGGPDRTNPHPDKKVPALLHDEALVTESTAIAIYLCDLFPEAGLAPRVGETGRGAFLTWMCWFDGELGPAIFERMAAGDDAPASAGFEAVVRRIGDALARGPYVLGDRFSAADVMLGGVLFWAGHLLAGVPGIDAYRDRLAARSAFARGCELDAPRQVAA
jgi:glutathione S-transferase